MTKKISFLEILVLFLTFGCVLIWFGFGNFLLHHDPITPVDNNPEMKPGYCTMAGKIYFDQNENMQLDATDPLIMEPVNMTVDIVIPERNSYVFSTNKGEYIFDTLPDGCELIDMYLTNSTGEMNRITSSVSQQKEYRFFRLRIFSQNDSSLWQNEKTSWTPDQDPIADILLVGIE